MSPKTEQRKALSLILFAIIFYFVFRLIQPIFYNLYEPDYHLSFHVILELFSITISFAIAIQAWVIFPHAMSRRRLQVAAIFFSVGILDLFHTLTYEGMTLFTSESSIQKATWFWVIARLTQAVGLLLILNTRDRLLRIDARYKYFSLSGLLTTIVVVIVFIRADSMPTLVIEGQGTTALKNGLEYLTCFLILLTLISIYRQFQRTKKSSQLTLMSALTFLFFSSLVFTNYASVHDLDNIFGHVYKVIGFFFLFRGIYYATIEEPFLEQKKAEERLHSIVETIPSGIVLLSDRGEFTFINKSAEKILNVDENKLLGSNILNLNWEFFSLKHQPLKLSMTKDLFSPTGIVTEQKIIIQKSNHDKYYLSLNSAPMFDDANNFIGTVHAFNDISEQILAEERIEFLAHTDSLTGLPNYYSFMKSAHEMVDEAKQTNKKFALFLLDLDQFKKINDTLGHNFGDFVLEMLARKLCSIAQDDWLISRMGGDEFTLCMTIKNTREANLIAEKIHSLIQEPFILQGNEFHLTASIGISVFPYDGDNMKTLMKRADIAMFEAKTSRNNYHFYTKEMDEQSLELLILEQHLRKAIKNNELLVHYQPQYSLTKGKVTGFEALIRWNHPEKGMIPPSVFIPIAEETGMINEIGHWVLYKACSQLTKWHKIGYDDLSISVNLSLRQFNETNLFNQVKQVIDYVALDPTLLKLEITESMSMNVQHAIDVLNQLKELGVKISIDDFGTGYSSLSYLNKFPIDQLKIDQSFIRNMAKEKHNKAVIASIISIAKHLNVSVIAEGVETEEELNYLKGQGCFEIQGYYISKPLPADEITTFLEKQVYHNSIGY